MTAAAGLVPGSRWRSQVSDAEVIVVRGSADLGPLTCGGSPMVAATPGPVPAGAGAAGTAPEGGAPEGGPVVLGKRYSDPDGRVEVLCTRAGAGALALDGVELAVKEAKPLPASD